jgi:hypothetical protein
MVPYSLSLTGDATVITIFPMKKAGDS